MGNVREYKNLNDWIKDELLANFELFWELE